MSEGEVIDSRGHPLPPKRNRCSVHVERKFRGEAGLTFVLLNRFYKGLLVHFNLDTRKTYIHIDGPDCCPVCVLTGAKPRWYGFIGGWDLLGKHLSLIVLTEGAVQNCTDLVQENRCDNLLGLQLWVGRMNKSLRGPLACRLGGLHDKFDRDKVALFPLAERTAELFDEIPPDMWQEYRQKMRGE